MDMPERVVNLPFVIAKILDELNYTQDIYAGSAGSVLVEHPRSKDGARPRGLLVSVTVDLETGAQQCPTNEAVQLRPGLALLKGQVTAGWAERSLTLYLHGEDYERAVRA